MSLQVGMGRDEVLDLDCVEPRFISLHGMLR
jgi:hypothetical protein